MIKNLIARIMRNSIKVCCLLIKSINSYQLYVQGWFKWNFLKN